MINDVSVSEKMSAASSQKFAKNNFKNIFAQDEFTIDNINLRSLWPAGNLFNENPSDLNDLSTILLVSYGDFDTLLLGDAGVGVQSRINLVELAGLVHGRLDVLKVSHHGSVTGLNKELIAALQPINCVISVGKNNSYGLPDPEVTDFLEKKQCKVYRTDLDGTIEFVVK